MMMVAEVAYLLLLHDPSGREIRVQPGAVISLRAGTVGEPNKLVHEAARCVVNLADGKYVAVTESCEEVQDLLAATGMER